MTPELKVRGQTGAAESSAGAPMKDQSGNGRKMGGAAGAEKISGMCGEVSRISPALGGGPAVMHTVTPSQRMSETGFSPSLTHTGPLPALTS